jgi:hypothetical protein
MFKLICLLTAILFTFTLSVPVRCLKESHVLENTHDDCSGRVCQAKCPCGESVYFNLEKKIKKNPEALRAYAKTCFGSGFGLEKDDGFLVGELQKSLSSCKVRTTANSFLSLKNFMGLKMNKKVINGPSKRVPYPPHALYQFAVILREFVKICEDQGDFHQVSLFKLNQKLSFVKKAFKFDLSGNSKKKCVLEQLNVMRDDFANKILKSRDQDLDFCSCKRLANSRVRRVIPGKKVKGVSPFGGFKQKFEAECKKVCSGTFTLEFLE